MPVSSIIRSAACGLAFCTMLAAAENLVPEGAISDGGGQPKGWVVPAGQPDWMLSRFRVIADDDRVFVRCESAPGIIEVAKPIDAAKAKQVTATYAFRLVGFQQGSHVWDVPYLELNFRDQAGKELVNHTAQHWESTDTTGWAKRSFTADVPAGAVTVFVDLGYKAAAGKADWADIALTVAE